MSTDTFSIATETTPARCGTAPACAVAGFICMCLTTLFAIPAYAQKATTRHDIEAATPRLEAYIEKAMAQWGAPGLAVGIVADDRLVYARGFGVRRAGTKEPIDADTVFQIGSTTKAFLSATEAILVDEGKLDWMDLVIDHDPAFILSDPWVTREFRIADLLTQRSGLPFSTLTNMVLYGYPQADIIRALRHVAPVTSFRSTFAYQNAFHLIAGQIIARRGGTQTWEQFLQQRLLTPLGMKATSYTANAIENADNHATGHRFDTQQTIIDPFSSYFPYNAGGAGALNSNVSDLSRWVRFHINGGKIDGRRIVQSQALTATYEPKIPVTGAIADSAQLGETDTISYASGWFVHSTPQGRVIEHAGGTVGFASHIAFDPDRRFGVIVLANQTIEVGTSLALPVGKYVLDLLQGRKPTDYAANTLAHMRRELSDAETEMTPPKDALPPSHPLDAYTGTYESPVLGSVEITKDTRESLVFALGARQLPVKLSHWSNDVFIAHIPLPVRDGNGRIDRVKLRFSSDTDGRIDRFDWIGEGDASGQPPFVRTSKE